MSAPRIDVLLLGGEATATQRKLVVELVLPRFAEWCRRIGLGLRTAHTESARVSGCLELRLPVRPRSPRVAVADQIFSDLCAAAAARHPDRLMAAMEYQMRPPEPVTQPAVACFSATPPPAPPPPSPPTGSHSTTILPTCSVATSTPPPRPRLRRRPEEMGEPGPLVPITFEVRVGGRVQTHRVAARSITLGRGASCDVIVPDGSVSRKHALIEVWRGGAVVVKDLGSSNSVFVNGQKVTACKLEPGDSIRLGAAEVRVTFPRGKP